MPNRHALRIAEGPLERTQEVQQRLLVGPAQHVEVVDDRVRLRARARMRLDGLDQILGAAVMQEEDALSDAPQRCAAELASARTALPDAVGQSLPHVVQRKVAVRLERLVALSGEGGVARRLVD